MNKKLYIDAVKSIVVEIEGERVEVPFNTCYLTTAYSECECCGESMLVEYKFKHRGKTYKVVLKDT